MTRGEYDLIGLLRASKFVTEGIGESRFDRCINGGNLKREDDGCWRCKCGRGHETPIFAYKCVNRKAPQECEGMRQVVALLSFRAEAEGECKSDGADTEGVDMIWEEKWRYPQLVCVAPSPFLKNTAPNAHREGT